MSSRRCFELTVTEEGLEYYRQALFWSDQTLAMRSLADAIGSELARRGLTNVELILYHHSPPRLVLFGDLNETLVADFALQTRALTYLYQDLHYVTYQQAEESCERLAMRLRAQFDPCEMATFHFTAIPRGGLIVLGMLVYILGLDKEQIEAPYPVDDTPLVVVDDCALTGFRFRQFLQRCRSSTIIFAPLYSHPDLRTAIVAHEPRVLACLSGRELHDYGKERWGKAYSTWREQKLVQMEKGRYWIGQTEHLCFPWGEPDRLLIDPTSDGMKSGWRIVPPELCIKNRLPPGMKPIPVQAQPESKGPLRPAKRVVFGDLGNEIVVGDLESRRVFGLRGSAIEMWRAIVQHGNLEDAVTGLLQVYAVEKATLARDLYALADQMMTKGLLEWKTSDDEGLRIH